MHDTPPHQLRRSAVATARRLADTAAGRADGTTTWILIVELFLGLGWTRAFVEKLIDPAWWRGDALRQFAADHDALALDWFEPFLTGVVVPLAVPVSLVVLALEGLVAFTFLAGRGRPIGLTAGIGLNLVFLAAGAVNPSAFYLVLQGALAVAVIERSGADLRRVLFGVEVVVITAAVISATSIRTLHPAHVIEDPAVMVMTLAALTVLATELVLRRGHESCASSRSPIADEGRVDRPAG